MGCVNSDGSLTSSARELLKMLAEPHTAQEVAQASGKPLFMARSSLREMVEAELIEEINGKYKTTVKGKSLIA